MKLLGEMNEIESDLAQAIRLALAEQIDDVRLFAAKLVRKYRNNAPELAEQVDMYLRSKPTRAMPAMRKLSSPPPPTKPLPVDDESRLSLLKAYKETPDRT